MTLRPELTASVVRSYINTIFKINQAPKDYFIWVHYLGGNVPKKEGNVNFTSLELKHSSENPEQDVEIISIAWHLLSLLGISNKVQLKINSIGSNECRKNYRKALLDFIKPHFNILSEVSKVRFKKESLRILDTKIQKREKFYQTLQRFLITIQMKIKPTFKQF